MRDLKILEPLFHGPTTYPNFFLVNFLVHSPLISSDHHKNGAVFTKMWCHQKYRSGRVGMVTIVRSGCGNKDRRSEPWEERE